LPGGERSLAEIRAEAATVVEDPGVRDHLVQSYGTRWFDVWQVGNSAPRLLERVSPEHAVIGAELVYAVQREFAITLGDLLIRRTHLAFEMPDQALAVASVVVDWLTPVVASPGRDRETLLREYDNEVRQVFDVG
jgi:glycerol-3-phosphate dehydrogenase